MKTNLTSDILPLSSILIANRGEIASRVIRTCKKMGIKSIAVFSEADRNAPFVAQADTAIFIGESEPAKSYLDQDKIIEAAKQIGADAIHPGYGFLSENVSFAERCKKENIVFIGPNPQAIASMGSKSEAKALMIKNKVPTVPGYQGKDQSIETLTKEAIKIGFPLLLKATAGGGGKGMRIVTKKEEIQSAIEAAKRESKNAFGDDELIIEKYVSSGRHIEFQIFGDKHGNIIHILERECSIQRRYQKVIEESPSPVLDDNLRNKMGTAAVSAAKAINYDNAGTVEFIFDDQTQEFYFLEVNTRLQVEHPVTEEITGLDLVQLQIEVAQGLPLSINQKDIKGKGYAIECRLYAEDASNDFLPVTGTIQRFEFPEIDGLRVETAIENGSEISIFYDPMIAKLIVWDNNRQNAHRKMLYVLKNMVCIGMITNQDFLIHLLENKDFQSGNYDTHFIQNKIDLSSIANRTDNNLTNAAIAACLFNWQLRDSKRKLLKNIPSGWRNNFNDYQQEILIFNEDEITVKYRFHNQSFNFLINDNLYQARIIAISKTNIRIEINGEQTQFNIEQTNTKIHTHSEKTGNITFAKKARFPVKVTDAADGGYSTPMPSQIVKILVKEGQEVKSGDGLVIISSMKMENTIEATSDGTIEEIYAQEGANVEAGFILLNVKSND